MHKQKEGCVILALYRIYVCKMHFDRKTSFSQGETNSISWPLLQLHNQSSVMGLFCLRNKLESKASCPSLEEKFGSFNNLK